MTDNWYKEIMLQKVYDLSPGESFSVVCIENGQSVREISEQTGCSPITTRALLRRARIKMTKKSKNMQFIVYHGDPAVEGAMVKMNSVKVLFKFAAKVMNAKQISTKDFDILVGFDPEATGDVGQINETTFRKADLVGTTSEQEAENRAEKLKTAYAELDHGKNSMGLAVIEYYLEKWSLKHALVEV